MDSSFLDSIVPIIQELGKKIKYRPNIFRILNIQEKENKHSDFIAWLLAPYRQISNNVGFLSTFINYVKTKYSTHLLDGLERIDFQNVRVFREKRFRTDILIEFREKRLIVVIENKINASEHGNQLNKYEEEVKKYYKKINQKFKYIFIYLTPDGIGTKNSPSWLLMSYKDLYQIIHKYKEIFSLSNGSNGILDDYLHILEEDIMRNSELIAKAKKIYRENRKAIDFIINYSEDKSQIISSKIEELLLSKIEELNLIHLRSSKKYINFTLKELPEIIGNYGTGNWLVDFPKEYFSFEFFIDKSKDKIIIRLKAVIGPTFNEKRIILRNYLLENQENLFKLSGKKGRLFYTTVFSKPITIVDLNEENEEDVFNLDQFENNILEFFNMEFSKIINLSRQYFSKHKADLTKILK